MTMRGRNVMTMEDIYSYSSISGSFIGFFVSALYLKKVGVI